MRTVRPIIFLAILACQAVGVAPLIAQTRDLCSAYQVAVGGGTPGSVPVVPDNLLSDWRAAVACIAPIIGSLNGKINSAPVAMDVRSKFLSATGAVRAIITRIGSAEDKNTLLPIDQRDPSIDTIAKFIAEFQKYQAVDVTSVLTFGAHSDSYDMRLNSVLILGNVLDETSVCVPLVHIYDPRLDGSDYGVNGRANLLGLLSKVAPWAYYEDFRNITNTRKFVSNKVAKDDPNLIGTNKLLDNIDKRLSSQTNQTNKNVHLPKKFKDVCRTYMDGYPPNDAMKANISYE
jgi:hypothetical protein